MMPRMRHLSLRVSYVCESMIIKSKKKDEEIEYIEAPHLRSFSISFVPRDIPYWFDFMYARNVCRRTHFDATKQLPNDHPLGTNGESGTTRFAEALQKAYNQGCYPDAKSIQIVSPMRINRVARGLEWSERESDEMILVRDCIKDNTYALHFIPSGPKYKHDPDSAIIDRFGVFAMGNRELLKIFVEDSRWAKTANYSARLSLDDPEAQFEKCSLKTLTTDKELKYFTESLAREEHEKLKDLHKDLTEGERHPARVFEFGGAGFAFKDFMPQNL
jgi:hypothetical protein